MTEKIICEKCGTEMVSFQRGSSCGMECPKCGWGWATTYWPEIASDETNYTISIPAISNPPVDIIRYMSKILSCNFIVANEKLKTTGIQVAGQARKIQEIRKKLMELGVVFSISPDFPYDLNDEKIEN